MAPTEFERLLTGLPRRRVVVISDRYPPDTGGGAERSLHLMLREPVLRDGVLVVAFDKVLDAPARRAVDGVEVVALPAPAAWPLHRRTQAEVERLKARPFGLKWPAFAADVLADVARNPADRLRAFGLRMLAAPEGGVAMEHATTPGSAMETAVARLLDAVRPDLVHADNARAITVAAGALAGHRIPLVAVVRDHRFSSARFDQTPAAARDARWGAQTADAFAKRALAFRQERLRRADRVVVASDHLAASLAGIVAGDRLRHLPLTPVEPADSVPEPPAGFNVLIVGTLAPNKGQERFLDGWPNLAARVPEAALDLAGRGPSNDALARRIAALGAGERVRLHGHVEGPALAALYARAHVVALPTVWAEPFGRVAVEAGAAGRPVVAYGVGGHAETVADGVNGILAAPGDLKGFVDGLVALACDPALRARLGAAGRARAPAFAPAPLAAGLATLWDEALRRRD